MEIEVSAAPVEPSQVEKVSMTPWVRYLLLKLAEEACEVGQESSKCLVFGPDAPWQGTTPGKRLNREYNDFVAVALELAEQGIHIHLSGQMLDAKRAKLKRDFEGALARGTF